MLNKKSKEQYSDRVEFHLLELPKLKNVPQKNQKGTLYKWCKLFAANTWQEYEEIAKGDEAMEAAVDVMREISMSESEWLEYWNHKLARMDQVTQTNAATNRGIKIGEERTARLSKAMKQDNRVDELLDALSDSERLHQLFEEYHIE